MAAEKPHKNHEEMRVKVEQAKREVLPAVELEKKEIKMVVLPPMSPEVPSIVMTFDKDADSKSNGADKIVGISAGPQGGDTQTLTDITQPPDQTRLTDTEGKIDETVKQPPSPKLGARLTVETEHLMEFFEDKKKTQGLSPKRTSSKKRRTPSPSPIRQSIGLDHLDNLVRLMEQLGSLRDENSRLKHRCDYLESTKTLLIAKSSLDEEDTLLTYHSNSLPRSKKGGKSHSTKSSKSDSAVRFSRPRLPSAEDAHLAEIDFSEGGQRLNGKPLYKRSFSTGSLEVPSDILEQSGEDELGSHTLLDDPFLMQDPSKLSKSPESKRKSKFSKWAKVKKVLNKQQVQEHITSGIKSIKGFGKGAYLRYAPVTGRELAVPPAPSVAESRSVDSGVGSGMDGEMDVRKSTSSNEPPSPTRFIERHIDVPTPVIDDCMGIWLGPPEWIEKEREKEQQLLKMTTGGLSESPKSEPGDLGSPQSVSGYDEDGEQYLQVPLIRRQSSPLLLEGQEEEVYDDSHLKRTSSYKEGGGDIKEPDESFHKIEKGEKKHRTPWGKMKNIIHTGRKDSVKKKGKGGETFTFEEVSETDFDVYDEMKYLHEGYFEGPVGRSTPKASPVIFRQKQRDKSSSISPPVKEQEATKVRMSGGSLNVTTLLGGVTDEFTRKLQEWEELKGKRSSGQFKESLEYSEGISNESAGAVSPEFLKKMEEWERVKSLKGTSISEKKQEPQETQVEPESETSSDEIEEVCTPPDRSRQSVNVEEIQRKLTDSFSRKMEEWERQKYQRQPSSDVRDPPQKSSFKERPKSKKTKEEKEREKYEKMREREILRVEREEQKLEKEKMRIEKERLKALEREAKIEKMKGRLSQPDMDSSLKNPVLSPLTDYKVTADFARKLHEWELRKGKEMSTAMYLEAQKRSLQFSMEYQNATNMLAKNGEEEQEPAGEELQMMKTSSESDVFLMEETGKLPEPKQKGEKPPPLTLVTCMESPDVSPKFPVSDDSSIDDHTSETHESMTQANIASLEKANHRLLEELRQRELEYNSLQVEVKDLNERLVNFRNEHALELDLYRAQLMEQGTSVQGDITLDTQHMSHTLLHLEDKIADLKKFGEQLAMSMEGAAVGKFQTVEGEESINTRLVDLLDKMRLLLQQATITGENTLEEVSKKSSALHSFEKLYSQAMHLQVQMNNLRLSQLERNKEIMNMKRHLLLQEANNLLLQADVTRREAELLYYKEYSQKRAPIKRWNTYSGKEDRGRIPGQESPQKQSIFQRVQRLRSARPLISSTTDSDSDVPTPPVRRESPRVRKRESPKLRKKDSPTTKRESPKLRKKESPTTRRRESPNQRRKQESPRLRRKESPKLAIHQPILEERGSERLDELKPISSLQADTVDGKQIKFSTVSLPTAKVTLPKDISPQEINGVPRSVRDKGGTQEKAKAQQKQQIKPIVEEIIEESKAEQVQTLSDTGAKFPELLIPEWKRHTEQQKKMHLHRMPHIDPEEVFDLDNDVFIDKIEEKQVTLDDVRKPARVKLQECAKLGLDKSFDSSETSEDTLKYLSPEPSPAPKVEPPRFPAEIQVIRKPQTEPSFETASDPGRSRPTSLIKVSVQTPVLLRKPPTGQQIRGGQTSRLNIPVIPLKRIKPAQELLDDSQRYRSGHSIYLTRILKRYPMKIECRSRTLEERAKADKENIKAGYVQTIVKQLSREGTPSTPDSGTSPKLAQRGIPPTTLSRTDSPKSEFVQQIVRKLSSPSGPTPSEKSGSPLKDLTNDGQVQSLKKAFTTNGEKPFVSVTVKGSSEFVSQSSSGTSSTLTFSQLSTKTEPGQGGPDSTISSTTKVTYSSMPMLSLEGDESIRERSATTSNGSNGSPSSHGRSYSLTQDSPTQRHRIHVAVSMSPGRSRRVIDPSLSPARLRRLMDPASPGRRRRVHEPSPIEQVEEEPLEVSLSVAQSETLPSIIDIKTVPRRSPKTKRKDKSAKMGTIEALCRQSMTFDLGVSLQGAEGTEGAGTSVEADTMRHSTSSATSTSSQSESEGASGTSEKKKSRNKFLESSFIQKSRKFFKVSKENRCPSLECCGSDRELHID